MIRFGFGFGFGIRICTARPALVTALAAGAVGATLAAAPPSGRPPQGPLERYKPRVYDLTFDVTLTTAFNFDAGLQANYELTDTPVVVPVILQGTYSAVQPDSIRPQLWLEGREDLTLPQRARLDDGYPFQTRLVVIPVPSFHGKTLRFAVTYRAQAWSSRMTSEQAAASVPWPRDWPEEVKDGLQPQMYIESNDPVFARAVEQASQGRLRMVPPYYAAKELVRYCINNFRMSGNGLIQANLGVVRGMEIAGAQVAAANGRGSPNDLVCLCVATLRAAGIPARPVIGVEKPDDEDELRGRNTTPRFKTWAEFFLPDVGWVPFDPVEMAGKGVRNLDVSRAWPEFGTMKDLNRRVPLGYHFLPPATVEAPYAPGVWGWDPRPGDPGTEPIVRFTVLNRGKGRPDPRGR